MSRAGLQQFVHTLRDALAPPGAAPSDADLLTRFAAADESAFELLVVRHGPMVFRVCRRLLRHTQDAEDAFQATFLALARKAASVRHPEALAGWLHCTAHRAASRLRARKPVGVAPLETDPAGAPPPEPGDGELLAAVEEEVGRLPEKYRLAVVLCYLQGRPTDEAAALLGCPQGTVFSRLAWARDRLRQRLARRGVTQPGAALGTLLAHNAPLPGCAGPLARAAAAVAAGGSPSGAVPNRVLILTQGVIGMTWFSQLSSPLALLVSAAALLGTASLLPRRAAAPAAAPAVAEKAAAADDELSVASLPPVVVKAVPQAGDTEVDAKEVKEIKVTFSKDMRDKSWSWSQISNDSFPKVTGKIRYENDKRTCVLPVQLEPGKTYVIWVNSAKFNAFKDADGRGSVPYLLVFQTKK